MTIPRASCFTEPMRARSAAACAARFSASSRRWRSVTRAWPCEASCCLAWPSAAEVVRTAVVWSAFICATTPALVCSACMARARDSAISVRRTAVYATSRTSCVSPFSANDFSAVSSVSFAVWRSAGSS